MLGWTRDLPILFRSPLCRHITLAVFLSIITIEAIILVPSYWSQEARLLSALSERARIIALATVNGRSDRLEPAFGRLTSRQMLAHQPVRGVALFTPAGSRMTHLGEQMQLSVTGHGEFTALESASAHGPRYEVFWPAGTLFDKAGVALSLDRSEVVAALKFFVLRIGGLITLIAAFVTLTTMLVLGRRLIFPMLQLHERLIVGQDDTMELDVPAANQTDEFGDIIRKFNNMLAELYGTKRELENRVAERTADLAQSEERLRAIIDNSPSIIYLKDTESRILLINKAYEERFGVNEDTARGSQGQGWLGQADAEQLILQDQKVIAAGQPVQMEYVHTNPDGTIAVTQSIKFPVRDPSGNVIGIGGIGTDITERKQAEEALQAAKLAAETAAAEAGEANKAKSNFLAIMSHELRTPMNGVLGMADLISKSDLTADQREFIDLLQESGNTLMDLLNDILDLSKIEAGRVQLEIRDFSIKELLNATRKLWAHSAQDKGLVFSIQNSVEDFDLVRSDRNRLRQVINNLIGNAVKFTAEGQIELHVSDTDSVDGNVELRFEITDTGIGISEEQRDLVFQPFTQADSSTTRNYGGTGLGLTICRNLVALLGGEMGVESAPESGSTFWFTIRAGRGEKSETVLDSTSNAPDSPIESQNYNALRILVAEDNDINQTVISWMLAPLNCQFDIVGNGLEAVAAVARSSYDLVLMDIQMPDMDGIAATKRIRSLEGPTANIPIIAMTANAMRGDREKYLEAGMTDYVAKSIDHRDLLSAITRVTDTPMPDLDDDALSAAQVTEETSQPISKEAAEKFDAIMNDLDDLLDGTGG